MRLLVIVQLLHVSQWSYCVNVKEELNDILGAIDTRNEVIRQPQTLIAQHPFCDDAFIAEALILGSKYRNSFRLLLVSKCHDCIDKVKGHLWSQKYYIGKNKLEIEENVVAM